MRNRKAQHERRRKKLLEERPELRSVTGYKDPTAYKAMKNILLSKGYTKILANK